MASNFIMDPLIQSFFLLESVTRTTWAANHGGINGPTRAQEEVPGALAMYPKRATRLGGVAAAAAVIRLTRAPDPELVGIARRPKGGR
jgi:hypothetical protein